MGVVGFLWILYRHVWGWNSKKKQNMFQSGAKAFWEKLPWIHCLIKEL
jgi:hypothetical protein